MSLTAAGAIGLAGLIASLVGGGVKAGQAAKHQKENKALAEDEKRRKEAEAVRAALARKLGVDARPVAKPIEQLTAPDASWADYLQGVGQSVASSASSEWGKQMFPTRAA